MSSGRKESREWRFYVTDMIKFGEKALSYTEGMDQATFVADARTYDAAVQRTYDAALYNLVLIGEAAIHIPNVVRDAHPEVPLRKIIGARNRIIHGYLGIDDELVWDIIQEDIPELLSALRRIVEPEQ